jgi:hypothetical protein
LLNASAASSLGWTIIIGAGSRSAWKPNTFSINEVLSSCVATIALMMWTPGSVTASIGPRAISTSLVRQSPAVLPAPRGFFRCCQPIREC